MRALRTKRTGFNGPGRRFFYLSPLYLLAVVSVIIFVIEAFIMIVLSALPVVLPLVFLIDSAVLVAIVFPALYLLFFRPLVMNINERKMTEAALRESEERFEKISSSAHDAIIMVDSDEKISYWNPASERVFGYRADEAVGREFSSLIVPPRYRKAFKTGFERFRETGEVLTAGRAVEAAALRKDGSEFPVEFSVSAVKVRGRWSSVGTVRDIAERKRSEETVKHMAFHDSLTGLPNRLLLIDRLNQVLSGARRRKRLAAVLFLDLDRFKYVNDSLGHEAGDGLLRAAAERLRGCTRGTDVTARLGGDEFAIILQDARRVEDVVRVAKKVISVFKEPFDINGEKISVTASIGISVYPEDGGDPETLLKSADTAMYRAKEDGRGGFQLFTSEMNEKAAQRVILETRLRRAVDRGEFLLHYQPQVDITTGEVACVEALLRWQDPEKGVLLPEEFLCFAEETGLIVPIEWWALRTACLQMKAWHDSMLKTSRVSMNLSPRQLRERDFAAKVEGVLKETGLEAKYLELEISECILVEGPVTAGGVLRELKDMGVRLAIDDFGTGCSCLEHLKKIPVSVMKLSRSFIRGIASNPDDRSIVTAIIRVGHSFRKEVVAVGVETAEQLTLLKRMQCDRVQGFLFSRPRPAVDAETFLGRGRRFLPENFG